LLLLLLLAAAGHVQTIENLTLHSLPQWWWLLITEASCRLKIASRQSKKGLDAMMSSACSNLISLSLLIAFRATTTTTTTTMREKLPSFVLPDSSL